MSEPLDLAIISEKWLRVCPSCDAALPMACTRPAEDYRPVMLELVNEAERLRAELARRDEQIAAVRALHEQVLDGGSYWCDADATPWPCWTIRTLDGGAS